MRENDKKSARQTLINSSAAARNAFVQNRENTMNTLTCTTVATAVHLLHKNHAHQIRDFAAYKHISEELVKYKIIAESQQEEFIAQLKIIEEKPERDSDSITINTEAGETIKADLKASTVLALVIKALGDNEKFKKSHYKDRLKTFYSRIQEIIKNPVCGTGSRNTLISILHGDYDGVFIITEAKDALVKLMTHYYECKFIKMLGNDSLQESKMGYRLLCQWIDCHITPEPLLGWNETPELNEFFEDETEVKNCLKIYFSQKGLSITDPFIIKHIDDTIAVRQYVPYPAPKKFRREIQMLYDIWSSQKTFSRPIFKKFQACTSLNCFHKTGMDVVIHALRLLDKIKPMLKWLPIGAVEGALVAAVKETWDKINLLLLDHNVDWPQQANLINSLDETFSQCFKDYRQDTGIDLLNNSFALLNSIKSNNTQSSLNEFDALFAQLLERYLIANLKLFDEDLLKFLRKNVIIENGTEFINLSPASLNRLIWQAITTSPVKWSEAFRGIISLICDLLEDTEKGLNTAFVKSSFPPRFRYQLKCAVDLGEKITFEHCRGFFVPMSLEGTLVFKEKPSKNLTATLRYILPHERRSFVEEHLDEISECDLNIYLEHLNNDDKKVIAIRWSESNKKLNYYDLIKVIESLEKANRLIFLDMHLHKIHVADIEKLTQDFSDLDMKKTVLNWANKNVDHIGYDYNKIIEIIDCLNKEEKLEFLNKCLGRISIWYLSNLLDGINDISDAEKGAFVKFYIEISNKNFSLFEIALVLKYIQINERANFIYERLCKKSDMNTTEGALEISKLLPSADRGPFMMRFIEKIKAKDLLSLTKDLSQEEKEEITMKWLELNEVKYLEFSLVKKIIKSLPSSDRPVIARKWCNYNNQQWCFIRFIKCISPSDRVAFVGASLEKDEINIHGVLGVLKHFPEKEQKQIVRTWANQNKHFIDFISQTDTIKIFPYLSESECRAFFDRWTHWGLEYFSSLHLQELMECFPSCEKIKLAQDWLGQNKEADDRASIIYQLPLDKRKTFVDHNIDFFKDHLESLSIIIKGLPEAEAIEFALSCIKNIDSYKSFYIFAGLPEFNKKQFFIDEKLFSEKIESGYAIASVMKIFEESANKYLVAKTYINRIHDHEDLASVLFGLGDSEARLFAEICLDEIREKMDLGYVVACLPEVDQKPFLEKYLNKFRLKEMITLMVNARIFPELKIESFFERFSDEINSAKDLVRLIYCSFLINAHERDGQAENEVPNKKVNFYHWFMSTVYPVIEFYIERFKDKIQHGDDLALIIGAIKGFCDIGLEELDEAQKESFSPIQLLVEKYIHKVRNGNDLALILNLFPEKRRQAFALKFANKIIGRGDLSCVVLSLPESDRIDFAARFSEKINTVSELVKIYESFVEKANGEDILGFFKNCARSCEREVRDSWLITLHLFFYSPESFNEKYPDRIKCFKEILFLLRCIPKEMYRSFIENFFSDKIKNAKDLGCILRLLPRAEKIQLAQKYESKIHNVKELNAVIECLPRNQRKVFLASTTIMREATLIEQKLREAQVMALDLKRNKWTTWNGGKKAELILESIAAINKFLKSNNFELLDSKVILSEVRSEGGLTLAQALGWHRIPSFFNEDRRKKARSLSIFEETENKVISVPQRP